MAFNFIFLVCLLFASIDEGFGQSNQYRGSRFGSITTTGQVNSILRCCGPSCTKNVFLSVVTNEQEPECRLRVSDVPLYATLYEVMLLAEQQYPLSKFSFSVDFNKKYGHFIDGINTVLNSSPFFWCIYNSRGVPLPVGVDFTYPSNRDAYIWSYDNTTQTHCSRYQGPCLRRSVEMEDSAEDDSSEEE